MGNIASRLFRGGSLHLPMPTVSGVQLIQR